MSDKCIAISKRVPPETGRGRGGFRGRGGGGGGSGSGGGNGGYDESRFRRAPEPRGPPAHDTRHISPRAEQGVAVPPAVPGFGFQLPFQMG